jgi:hypothetical protein
VNQKLKNKLYLMATVLSLLLAVNLVYDNPAFDENSEVCCDCPDFVNHTLHSHIQIFQDEALDRESYSCHQRPELFNDFTPGLNPVFIDSYCSKVWQPPKIS